MNLTRVSLRCRRVARYTCRIRYFLMTAGPPRPRLRLAWLPVGVLIDNIFASLSLESTTNESLAIRSRALQALVLDCVFSAFPGWS